jgi:hypothetical protein
MVNEKKLDLACGDGARTEGFFGIDIQPGKDVDYIMDLQKYPWDIESDSAEEVRCAHYLEHIKHDNVNLDLRDIINKSSNFDEFKELINSEEFIKPRDGLIKFMNELYRIMKVGGKVTLISPYYSSDRAFGDPTHVRYMCDWSFFYFNKTWRKVNKLEQYGIDCDFDVKYSYGVDNEMCLKSEEVRAEAIRHHWNSATDIMAELIKR